MVTIIAEDDRYQCCRCEGQLVFRVDQGDKWGRAWCPRCDVIGPEVRTNYDTSTWADWHNDAATEFIQMFTAAPERSKGFARGVAYTLHLLYTLNLDAEQLLNESGLDYKDFVDAEVDPYDLEPVRRLYLYSLPTMNDDARIALNEALSSGEPIPEDLTPETLDENLDMYIRYDQNGIAEFHWEPEEESDEGD